MPFKPKLQAKQTQRLGMTKQLSFAINLLSLNNIELQRIAQTEVDDNPLLEFENEKNNETRNDHISAYAGKAFMEGASVVSLRDHLREQVMIMTAPGSVKHAALYLIDELKDDGYLNQSLDKLAVYHKIDLEIMVKGHQLLLQCEPAGVGARTIKECFEVQLNDKGCLSHEMQLFLDHMYLYSEKKTQRLEQKTGLTHEQILNCLALLKDIEPRPGHRFEESKVDFVAPDIFVNWSEQTGWHVELNQNTLPKLYVNNSYFSNMVMDEKAQAFILEYSKKANWLLRSIERRNKTMLMVALVMVQRQAQFLKNGVLYMQPLGLAEIADETKLSVSTVSRVMNSKYIACGQGTLPFKYFLSSKASADSKNGNHSARSVQFMIQEMVREEKRSNILSDEDIVSRLSKSGVIIKRRTVAKYRKVIGIPSSRKRLGRYQSPNTSTH